MVLHWCVCHLAHKVPGWCFCDSLGKRQQRAFLEEKENLQRKEAQERKQRRREAEARARLAGSSSAHDACLRLLKGKGKRKRVALREAALLAPQTPNARDLGPEPGPEPEPSLPLVTFSSLLPKPAAKRQKAPPLARASQSVVAGADGGGGGPGQARRRLEGDFIESAKREKDLAGGTAGAGADAQSPSSGGAGKGKSKAYRRMMRKYQMPWHSWFCMGCGKKLPNGHIVSPNLHSLSLSLFSSLSPVSLDTRGVPD